VPKIPAEAGTTNGCPRIRDAAGTTDGGATASTFWLACLLATLILLLAGPTVALGQVPWVVPETVQTIDFSSQNSARTIVFRDDGMAIEVPRGFPMIRHEKVTIVARLPEPGRFDIELTNGQAMVEVNNLGVKDGQATAEIVAKLPVRGWEEIRQMALEQLDKILQPHWAAAEREMKARGPAQQLQLLKSRKIPIPEDRDELLPISTRLLAVERGAGDVRREVQKFARERPIWISKFDTAKWSGKDGIALATDYQRLFGLIVAEEYLQRWGLKFDADTRQFDSLLETKIAGVHGLRSGLSIERSEEGTKANRAVAALAPDDRDRIRQALAVTLKCRFFPATDAGDPNSQWYNGQSVTCRAKGVKSVRVEGKLDPARQDRVDWWQLNGYDHNEVHLSFTENPAVRVVPPFVDRESARLRVVAQGDEAVDYWFEFQPRPTSVTGQKVIIHESPSQPRARFPF
jgi:hypothetical protein